VLYAQLAVAILYHRAQRFLRFANLALMVLA